jgi:hypothetical protein
LSDWLHALPVWWLAVILFACAFLCTGAIYFLVERNPAVWTRLSAFSPSMLSPMGTLFALLVVFTAAQVWSDTDRATAAVAQEASSLRAVSILAASLPDDVRNAIERHIAEHIRDAASREWEAMAHQQATLEVIPMHLAQALQLALQFSPKTPGQGIAQREMTVQLEAALDARRQRVLISKSSIGFVKWTCLSIEGVCVLVAIALSHGGRRASALVAMGLFAIGATACFLLIAAYDRPFVGQISIRPDPLLQVLPDLRKAEKRYN